MLIRFRTANHRSIREEHELTFVAWNATDEVVRATSIKSKRGVLGLLPAIGIFGANASGKSNVLSAIRAMRNAVLESVAGWNLIDGVPREPFALCAENSRTSLYEVEVLLGSKHVRHTYGFELSDTRVEAEWLHIYPQGHKQIWFERDGDRFKFPNDNLAGGDRLASTTRPNALFLTVAAAFNSRDLSGLHEWFRDGIRFTADTADATHGQTWSELTGPNRDLRRRSRITALLRSADLGVTDLRIEDGMSAGSMVSLLHHNGDGEPVALDFRTQESLGTHAWFNFLSPLLDVLERGSLLVVDELDSSLHPVLAAEVVRLFQSHDSNPHGGQLLFTTHDATLLGKADSHRPLNRDQVWLTEKRRTGETELYPLSDAAPRKDENLERGYLRGRYGGVPRTLTGEIAHDVADLLEAP